MGQDIAKAYGQFTAPFKSGLGLLLNPTGNADVQKAGALAGGGELAGAALGVGGGAGAGAGLDPTGLGAADVGFSGGQLGLSPGASGALGLGAAGGLDPTGLGAGDVGFGASGQLGLSPSALGQLGMSGGGSVPGAAAAKPGAATPATPPPAGGAPAAGTSGLTGIPQVDDALKWMKQNAVGLGILGVGAGSLRKPPPMPNEAQINALGAEGAATAHNLLSAYNTGALQPGQQASLDQLTQGTKNQINQYFSSIGQADSTAHQQALAQVDQQSLMMKQQMLDNMLQQGLQAIGIAQGPLNTVAQYQLGQDQALRQAFGNFAGALGNLGGRSAGSTGTTAAPTPTGTVQSASAPPP